MANKLKKLPNFKSPWLWRSCTQSRTLSFRTPNDIFRTINSAYQLEEEFQDFEDFEETHRADMSDEDQIEALVRGLRPGQRLFLELEETNSMTAAAAVVVAGKYQVPFKESVAMAVESKEPYLDFKKSMEEMVEAHGLKDWKAMEMLLSWYLKANGKPNHEFIIGAFVDLLVGLAFASSSSSSSSSSCSSSSSSSCCCSCLCNSPNFSSSSDSSSCFGGCIISTNTSVEKIMEDIVESECSASSTTPCLSSLFEDEENEGHEEDF